MIQPKVEVTEIAKSKIESFISKRNKGIGVRITVKTTGCSGLAYVLEFADQISNECFQIDFEKFKVLIDKKAAPYLDGMTIDYVKKGLNEGFEFINPNESGRCGCGESFRV